MLGKPLTKNYDILKCLGNKKKTMHPCVYSSKRFTEASRNNNQKERRKFTYEYCFSVKICNVKYTFCDSKFFAMYALTENV